MTEQLPPHTRVQAYAAAELALDVIHSLRQIFPVDVESALILLCVNEATMRPVVVDAKAPADILRMPEVPQELRSSISRLMVADKTGLPRETVRRKLKDLEKAGYVTIDDKDRVQIKAMLDDPEVQRTLESGHRSVLRYLARLREFGLDPNEPFKS